MMLFRVLMAFALASPGAYALEVSAGADTINNSQVGISTKIDASNALLAATINALTNKVKVCSAKEMLYNPGASGADTDNCVAITSLVQMKACSAKSKFHSPGDVAADADGCVSANASDATYVRKAFWSTYITKSCPFKGITDCVPFSYVKNKAADIDLGIEASQCFLSGNVVWSDNDTSLVTGGVLYATAGNHWRMFIPSHSHDFVGWAVTCIK